MRLYKSGTKWCFWRWTITDSEYITRLHLLKTPWFAICIHWLNKPDAEPYLHDHPVSFLSIILKGGYYETRLNGNLYFRHRFNFIRATDCHNITAVVPGTITIAFMGPKTREWGFHTETGWIHWKDYYTKQRKEKERK